MLGKLKIFGAAILSVLIGVLTLSFLKPSGSQDKADKDLKQASEDSERVSDKIEEVQKQKEALKDEEIKGTDENSSDFWKDRL